MHSTLESNKYNIPAKQIFLYKCFRKIWRLKNMNKYGSLLEMCYQTQIETLQEDLANWIEENVCSVRAPKQYQKAKLELQNGLYIKDQLDLIIFRVAITFIAEILPFLNKKFDTLILPTKNQDESPSSHPLTLSFDSIGRDRYNARRALWVEDILHTIKNIELAKCSELPAKIDARFIDDVVAIKEQGVRLNSFLHICFMSNDQSSMSTGGKTYEELVREVIHVDIGIPFDEIQAAVVDTNQTVEFDCFFTFEEETYGISVKKTSRERFRMNLGDRRGSRAAHHLYVTLGDDMNENKMRIFIDAGVIIFVADEIYDSSKYLQRDGVYPATKLTAETLRSISKSE